MSLAVCTMVVVLTFGSGATMTDLVATPERNATTEADTPQGPVARPLVTRAAVERWEMDVPEKRPAALPVMYASFAALQVVDVYSTRRALGAGAHEANPLMRQTATNGGAMLAVKALSTAGTIYFTEKAWKKNRKGALILMAAINGATAAIAARNLRNARRP